MLCLIAQSCPILCDPMVCSPPGFSVHGDSPGKNTGVGCHSLPQGIFSTQGLNLCSLHPLHWQAVSLPPAPPGKPELLSQGFDYEANLSFPKLPVASRQKGRLDVVATAVSDPGRLSLSWGSAHSHLCDYETGASGSPAFLSCKVEIMLSTSMEGSRIKQEVLSPVPENILKVDSWFVGKIQGKKKKKKTVLYQVSSAQPCC